MLSLFGLSEVEGSGTSANDLKCCTDEERSVSYFSSFMHNVCVHKYIINQADTCKTLGVVTIPKSLLARMRRSRVVELISYTRPRPAPLGAGRGREHESMSSRACHVKHHAS